MWTDPVASLSLLPTTWEKNVRYLVGTAEPYQEYLWDGVAYIPVGGWSGSLASWSIQWAIACIGSKIPTFKYTSTKTVGTGGDYANLTDAMSAPDNTRLLLIENQIISSTISVANTLLIDCDSKIIESATNLPVTMFNFTNGGGIINGVLQHKKTTNTSLETVIAVSSEKIVYIQNNDISCQEFGISLRGNYIVSGNKFYYIGASQTNSHRFIYILWNLWQSRIAYNEFTPITSASTRYSNFILMGQVAWSEYSGTLYINNNIQQGWSLRQFFLHEAGVTDELELYVANNQFDDLNGGIWILSPALFNSYAKIGIYNNIQWASATGNFKWLFFIDGTGSLSDDVELTYGGNETLAWALRTDYVSFATESTNLIARKTSATGTTRTQSTLEDVGEDLGALLQTLKGKTIYIVDSEWEALVGDGTLQNPYQIPQVLTWYEIVINGEYNGTETTIATGIVREREYRWKTYYRLTTTATNTNNYPEEDSIYTDFDWTDLSWLLITRG